jgi:hypothetical protein
VTPEEVMALAQTAAHGRWDTMSADDRLFFLAGVAAEQISTLRLTDEARRDGYRHMWLGNEDERTSSD